MSAIPQDSAALAAPALSAGAAPTTGPATAVGHRPAGPTAAVRKVLALFTPHERRRLYLLLPVIVAMAFTQVVGIASITPFLAVLADPGVIETYRALGWLYAAVGSGSVERFLFVLGLLVLVVLTLANAFTMAATWVLVRFTNLTARRLSERLLGVYLRRPYLFFTSSNSAELGKSILLEVNMVVECVLQPLMHMLAKLAVIGFVLVLLLLADPVLALIVTVALGGAYAVLFGAVRRTLWRLGQQRLRASRERFRVTSEALGGVKEIKLLGREREFVRRFSTAARELARCKNAQQTIMQLPHYGLETIAFGGILLIVLFLLAAGRDLGNAVPLLGLYAFASYRLMPAFQGLFSGLASIRANAAALDVLHADLRACGEARLEDRRALPALPLRDRLELRHVTFSYPAARRPLFDGLNLRVHARTTVAFVGPTGSGKTTLADLVLGLLRPDAGAVWVDGIELDEATLPRWQNGIGYVPQHIYLYDESIAQNIAFGVPPEEIDTAAVERAARAAQLHDFIVNDLAQGYGTVIGENGVRLSGGQRQRVGIARALYDDPDVLVMDEATSALDGATEQDVFRAVEAVRGRKTILMIAHRMSTVRNCDAIFVLERGRVVAQGTYAELLEHCPQFRAVAQERRPGADRQEVPSCR